MMKMHWFSALSAPQLCMIIVLTCILAILVVPFAAAADASIEAELGDTLNLHGVLYSGDRVYLFLTGPGLPENGVTLTDVTQRADQGKFTIVDVATDQTWSMKWKTSRIQNEIDPGTYLVYVTKEPVDKAHLGGASTYKTLEVYLKESTTSKGSSGGGVTYTLNPEEHVSVQSPVLALTTPVPTTTPVPSPTPAPVPPTLPPTTRAASIPFLSLPAVLIAVMFALVRQ